MEYNTIFQMDHVRANNIQVDPTVVAHREIDPETLSIFEETFLEKQLKRDQKSEAPINRFVDHFKLQKYFHNTKFVYKSLHLFNSERRHLTHYFDETFNMNYSSHIYYTDIHARVLNAETLNLTNLENSIHNVVDICNGETLDDYFRDESETIRKKSKKEKNNRLINNICAKLNRVINRKL